MRKMAARRYEWGASRSVLHRAVRDDIVHSALDNVVLQPQSWTAIRQEPRGSSRRNVAVGSRQDDDPPNPLDWDERNSR
jgi:hypothetical protein